MHPGDDGFGRLSDTAGDRSWEHTSQDGPSHQGSVPARAGGILVLRYEVLYSAEIHRVEV